MRVARIRPALAHLTSFCIETGHGGPALGRRHRLRGLGCRLRRLGRGRTGRRTPTGAGSDSLRQFAVAVQEGCHGDFRVVGAVSSGESRHYGFRCQADGPMAHPLPLVTPMPAQVSGSRALGRRAVQGFSEPDRLHGSAAGPARRHFRGGRIRASAVLRLL